MLSTTVTPIKTSQTTSKMSGHAIVFQGRKVNLRLPDFAADGQISVQTLSHDEAAAMP